MKYCKFCGEQIHEDAIICPKCGRQIEELKGNYQQQPNVVINNTNMNTNVNSANGKPKDKMLSIILCCIGFFGFAGLHKFYEGKAGMGILYLFTFGLFGIGWFIDCIVLLCKPNPYYVR